MKQKILIEFGEMVRKIRKEKEISQEELAHKANLHRTYIGMIERAEKNITLINIQKVARALEKNIKDFNAKELSKRKIVTSQHCYGCTAGTGSSCQGTVL